MYVTYYFGGLEDGDGPETFVSTVPPMAHCAKLVLSDCQWIVPGTVGVDD